MAKFMVSAEMAPGMYRTSVGFFKPGQTIDWPDHPAIKASKAIPPRIELPNRRLIPLDKEALKMLEDAWKGKKDEEGMDIVLHGIPGDVEAAKVAAKSATHVAEPEEPMTTKETVEKLGQVEDKTLAEIEGKGKGKKVRASDSK